MKSEKKARNDENIQQVVDVLTAANYRSGRLVTSASKQGSVEFWIGAGRIPVIALQIYPNDDGFEVFAPITQSNRMDETLVLLREITDKAPANTMQPPELQGAQQASV